MSSPSGAGRPRRGRAAGTVPREGGAPCPREAGRSEPGMAGGGWEEGMCAVGKGLIHVLALAFIVQEEKRNQEKYKAFHTLMKCETSRVIKPLKGKVGYYQTHCILPRFKYFSEQKPHPKGPMLTV